RRLIRSMPASSDAVWAMPTSSSTTSSNSDNFHGLFLLTSGVHRYRDRFSNGLYAGWPRRHPASHSRLLVRLPVLALADPGLCQGIQGGSAQPAGLLAASARP